MNKHTDKTTYAAIPSHFKEKPRWICWMWGTKDQRTGRWVPHKRETLEAHDGHLWHRRADGKLEKVDKLPVCVRTGRAANVSDPGTWTTFEEACAALDGGKYDGLGYILDNDEVLVDIDGCMVDGRPSDYARNIIGKLCSYAERSVSGEGVHVLVVAEGFNPNRGCKADRIEVYAGGHTNRYCTMSGDVLDGCEELNDDAEDVLSDLYATEFALRPVVSPEAAEKASETMRVIRENTLELCADDERAVAWMCGHFRWARSMFECGDYTGWAADRAKYNPSRDRSRSEADFALATYLLAATHGDPTRACVLLHTSGMWRPKYDEIHDGSNPYVVMTCGRAYHKVDAEELRARAIERRDERLDRYPARLSALVELMRADDVTDPMLRRVMALHARGDARQDIRRRVEDYPEELVDWMIERWPRVVELAYAYNLGR